MSILSVLWDPRAIWAALSFVARSYLVFLLIPIIYMTVTLITRRQTTQFRQFHYLCLLFFGVCLSNECFGLLRSLRFSTASLSALSIESFEPTVAFSFVVLAVLSFLHLLQWFVSSWHH